MTSGVVVEVSVGGVVPGLVIVDVVAVGDVCVDSKVDVPPHPAVSATLTSAVPRPVPNRRRDRPDRDDQNNRDTRRLAYDLRQRSRLSVALVLQVIGTPLLVTPWAPSDEQNAPECTTPPEGDVVVPVVGLVVVGSDVVVVGLVVVGFVVVAVVVAG